MAAPITSWVAVAAELFDVTRSLEPAWRYPGLFLGLAQRCGEEGLAGVFEAAWQRPFAPLGMLTPANQQHAQLTLDDREDDGVDGDPHRREGAQIVGCQIGILILVVAGLRGGLVHRGRPRCRATRTRRRPLVRTAHRHRRSSRPNTRTSSPARRASSAVALTQKSVAMPTMSTLVRPPKSSTRSRLSPCTFFSSKPL